MKKSTDLMSAASRFQIVSAEEQMLVEGGLSWSGIWGAIKGAANWAYDHVLVNLKDFVFGFKGTW